MIRAALCLSLITLPAIAAAQEARTPSKAEDCYCTDSNHQRIELGQTICLQVGGRMFMAQCQMSLNVPMWREVQQGCLSSKLGDPAFDPLGVDAHI